MSSQRRRRALQRQPSEGEPVNVEEELEVVEGVGEGAETAEDEGFFDDVDEPCPLCGQMLRHHRVRTCLNLHLIVNFTACKDLL